MLHYQSKAQKVFAMFNYTFLILVSMLCLVPFLNLLAISFSGSGPVAAGKVYFWPVEFTLESYSFAFRSGRFVQSLFVSFKRLAIGVSLNVILMLLTAYPLSKSKATLRARNVYMGIFVFIMIFNGGLIPTYLVVVQLGLLNNILALVLPTALPVWNMIILMNFMRQLPAELDEAASIDGAGPFMTLLLVIIPISKPALATVGLFSIVSHWNEWFNGIIYMQSLNNYPLQSYLQTMIRNFDQILRQAGNDYVTLLALMNARTGRAAQLFLGALPVLMIYPFLQKYFTTGLVMGSVKG
ncbi:MAG: carbohydrate ABC transporter permease [Oscillospiraceae bacterium]|nr:carbohydrate ABC transporter permease [Oscillospiraceae bacterium]